MALSPKMTEVLEQLRAGDITITSIGEKIQIFRIIDGVACCGRPTTPTVSALIRRGILVPHVENGATYYREPDRQA